MGTVLDLVLPSACQLLQPLAFPVLSLQRRRECRHGAPHRARHGGEVVEDAAGCGMLARGVELLVDDLDSAACQKVGAGAARISAERHTLSLPRGCDNEADRQKSTRAPTALAAARARSRSTWV